MAGCRVVRAVGGFRRTVVFLSFVIFLFFLSFLLFLFFHIFFFPFLLFLSCSLVSRLFYCFVVSLWCWVRAVFVVVFWLLVLWGGPMAASFFSLWFSLRR